MSFQDVSLNALLLLGLKFSISLLENSISVLLWKCSRVPSKLFVSFVAVNGDEEEDSILDGSHAEKK